MRLKDKVAIVTGGSSGIGEYTVREMINEGAKVLIADVNDEAGEKLATELNTKQKNAIYQHVDVSNEEDIIKMVQTAENEFGKLDIIFNNAGILEIGPSTEQSFEDWKKVISINLSGVFLSAKHAIKAMKKQGGGSVINCSSILGNVGQSEYAAYTAAKGGVTNMTRTLALEFAEENVRVNAVCPAYIHTPLLDDLDEETKNHLISLHPMKRLGRPEEIAKAVVFLASDDASFVTGINMLVDGGYTSQ